jgi:MFS family permease
VADLRLTGLLNRNTVVLFLAQFMFVSSTVLLVTVGGIIGSDISPTPALATLPLSLMVVGTALTTVPASLSMQQFGRRSGFLGAALLGLGGSLLGMWSVGAAHFAGFCLAAAMVGMANAFSQQFRFAAAESVSTDRVSQAVSFILLGSIGGAMLGPELVARSPEWNAAQPFQAAFAGACACYVTALILLSALRTSGQTGSAVVAGEAARPLGELVRLPLIGAAVIAGVVGQGVMTFIMTATPVSMHVVDGHALADTADVVRGHVVAMYLPSLIAAPLIGLLGVRQVMLLGALVLAATVALGLAGREVFHYGGSMILLGVGWNFLFVGGTSLLVTAYRPEERFRVQALNDFSVFGASALASLLAGALLIWLGWDLLLAVALLPVVLVSLVLLRLPRR